jgi:hypothetical protein
MFGIHHAFNVACGQYVEGMQVRDKRCIYGTMRKEPPVHPDSFLPKYGMTVGEFTTFNVLAPSGGGTTAPPR